MDKNKVNVPKIRFPGFTEPWEQRKLGETLKDLKSGLSRMLSNNNIGLPVIRANNINNGNLDMESDIKYWYKEDPQGAKTENYLVCKNDILINFINSEAKMGTSTIVLQELKRDTIYTTNILKAKVNSDYFPYYWFTLTLTQKYKRDIKIITKPAVNQASFTTIDFKKLSYKFPRLEEQKKIGVFFQQLDHLITLHQRKLNHLQDKKKSLLQKMFPKNDENFPELRFPGFTDPWEQRKFEDIFKLSQGLQVPISQRFLTEGANKYFYITNEFLKPTCDEKYYIENPPQSVICNKEDILMTRTGNTGIVVTDVEGCYHNNFFKIQYDKELLDKYFIVQLLSTESMKRRILNSAGSSTIPDLSHKSFYKLDSIFPKIDEQKKISEFILGLDNIITLHQRKLNHLQQQKKGLLQQMFI